MTPRPASSARVLAVEVLRGVLERGGRATALLAQASRGLSSQDGDLLREIVLGVLRNRARLDAELSAVSRVPLPRLAPNLREILELALYQVRFLDRVPAYAAVDEAVAHAKASGGAGAAGLVNAILRNLLRQPPRQPPLPPGEVRGEGATGATALARLFSHPEFLVERWLARFGEAATLQILEADNSPSGVDLLTNTQRTDRDSLAAALLSESISTEPSPLSPLALTVVSGNPFSTPLFAAGHFAVQDAGSQALPLLLPPGDTLLDLAAAPGGKSFSAVLHARARRAFALDRSVERLSLLAENRSRLGLFDVLPAAGEILAAPLAPHGFERVLFDAPCSGTGTLRKNPEIRYRVTAEAIARLAREQEEGLAVAADLLAPGGFLLYSTCSLEEEENERVVEHLLARRPEIEPAEIVVSGALAAHVSGNRFRLFPARANDGFTAHLLRRRAG